MKLKSAYLIYPFFQYLLASCAIYVSSKWLNVRCFQAHPWFKGIEWDRLYQMEAAFIPEVNDELDTQNFENFEEVRDQYFFHFDATFNCLFYSTIQI